MPILLVIDDEPAILHAFQRAFRDGDLTVRTATTAADPDRIGRSIVVLFVVGLLAGIAVPLICTRSIGTLFRHGDLLVPLGGLLDHEQSKSFGELLARVLARDLGAIATITRQVGRRGGKVYIDYLQNGRGKLLVAPYCVRPLTGAPVSTPPRRGSTSGCVVSRPARAPSGRCW